MNIPDILEQLNSISDSEKREIITLLSRSLIQSEINEDFNSDELTDKRYAHDQKCPHCASTAIVKNGTHNGR